MLGLSGKVILDTLACKIQERGNTKLHEVIVMFQLNFENRILKNNPKFYYMRIIKLKDLHNLHSLKPL